MAFGLNYDESCLAFDNLTDLNADGVPDSVRKTQPDFIYEVRHTDVNGDNKNEVVLVIRTDQQDAGGGAIAFDLATYNKVIAEVRFDVQPGCRTTDGSTVPVIFSFAIKTGQPRLPSISDDYGESLTKPPLTNHVVSGAYILEFNAAPTTVLLNGGTSVNFAENQNAGTVVGTLTTSDPNAGDTHTYKLVSCAPDDNYAFSIVGNQLRTKGPFDYEDDVVLGVDKSFKACIRATDPHGAYVDGTFTVNVTDVNEPAQDIQLLPRSVNEKEPVGTFVGNLSTLGDPDAGDSHTYALPVSPPAGCTGADNASFQISGAQLKTAAVFDASVQNVYIICVSSTDTGSNQIFKTLTVDVLDQDDPPVAVDDPDYQLILADTADPHIFNVLANDSDPESDDLLIGEVSPAPGPIVGGTINLVGSPATSIVFTPEAGYSGPVSFSYKAQEYVDYGWGPILGEMSNDATVSFYVVSDEDRGDCNNDTMIDAADFSATQLEMWDTADPLDWREIWQGDYAGSPVGCDSNSSRNGLDGTKDSVDVADVTCTVRLFFGEECAPIMGAAINQVAASLSVDSDLQVANDGSVKVPVVLDTAGQNVAAAAFILEYDPALFGVDPTDADGDGNPDAVAFSVPNGVAKIVSVDDQAGQIKIAVFGTSLPLPTFEDGVIATITLYGKTSVAGQSPVNLKQVSVGDDLGRSVPVDFDDGMIIFGIGGNSSLFLPLMQMP